MPEYITKSEPVDKKPYIVYTPEKNIVYSGDIDADVPNGGGSSTIRVYFMNNNDPTDKMESLTVKDGNNEEIETDIAEYTAEGQTIELKSAIVAIGEPVILSEVPSDLRVSWEYLYDPPIETLLEGAYFIAPSANTLVVYGRIV